MFTYKATFYRFNSHTKPFTEETIEVVFKSRLDYDRTTEGPELEAIEEASYQALWAKAASKDKPGFSSWLHRGIVKI